MGKIGGEFIIYRAPDSSPSFMEHLCMDVAEAVHNMRFDLFGENNYSLWPLRLAPYWGNDAFITDSYYDIPTPQLSCWPYRYYHTSMDLPEYISPDNLARTGVMCAAVLYFLADAGPREAAWLSMLAGAKARTRIADELAAEVLNQVKALKGKKGLQASAVAKLDQCAKYYSCLEHEATFQPLRFAPGDQDVFAVAGFESQAVSAMAEHALVSAQNLLGLLVGAKLPPVPKETEPPGADEARKLVPKRTAWRIPEQKRIPPKPRKELAELRQSPECKGINLDEVWPWANGKRNLLDLWRRLRYKREYPLQALVKYFRILERARLVEMVTRDVL
jgi:hypothetical protein